MKQTIPPEQLHIRNAISDDFDRICEIYAYARKFMRDHGNPRQWNTTWPPEELFTRRGTIYVVEDNDPRFAYEKTAHKKAD